MSTAKIYFNVDGNERTIHQMVKQEPEWAANRIQEGEKAIEQLQQEQEAKQELLEVLINLKLFQEKIHPDDFHWSDLTDFIEDNEISQLIEKWRNK
jgi:hypothetical protein